jgi:hypothetical protein
MKVCVKCKKELSLDSFHKNRSSKTGYQSYCKVCLNSVRKKLYSSRREYFKQYTRVQNLKRKYGISEAQYQEMLVKQNGLCAICRLTNRSDHRLVVDHDHKTGIIRGLLCHACNLMIGNSNDNYLVLLNGAEYLKNLS